MVMLLLLLLLLLDLGQTKTVDEPGQGQPTVSQETLDLEQDLEIVWPLHSNILAPLLPPTLAALFRRRTLKVWFLPYNQTWI